MSAHQLARRIVVALAGAMLGLGAFALPVPQS